MEIIKASSIDEARKAIDRSSREGKKIIVQGGSIDFNREILEIKKVQALLLEHKFGKDSLKQRDSGLNQVLCKIASKNGITLLIDFSELETSDRKEKAKILSRMAQNIKLTKKFRNKIEFMNFKKNERDLAAFLRVLGSSSGMAKEISSKKQLNHNNT